MAFPLLTSASVTSRRRLAFLATLALGLALVLPSCEKLQEGVVNVIEFPEHEPRLAVTMFVSPGDTVVYATVYQSAGVTDTAGSAPLKHAAVALMQGSTVLAQGDSTNWADPDPWNSWYSGPLMKINLDEPLELQPGAIALVVDASPTFEPLVVTEEVPEEPVFDFLFEAYADSVDEGWGYVYYQHLVTLDLENRPGVRDDYMISIEVKEVFEGAQWSNMANPAFPDPRMEYNDACDCLLATDSGADNVSLANLVLESYAGSSDYPIEGEMRIRVRRPTDALANHLRSVDAYYGALDNPFSEPASIQGNIPDGFGIFGVTTEVVVPL
ncbi:MAG: DUF4249 family protein [Bacteroidetes bacterium]|nr:DUF4249 family protein [Bacteroidota bacterium]